MCLGGLNDLKPQIRPIFKEKICFRNKELGVIFSTFTQWQVQRGLFLSELTFFRGHFSISLAMFRGGLQISSSRMGRHLYRELSPGLLYHETHCIITRLWHHET